MKGKPASGEVRAELRTSRGLEAGKGRDESAASTGQAGKGRRRLCRRPKRLDVQRLHAGEAWWLRFLIVQRYGLSIEKVAARAGVGEATLRDYLKLRHPEAWGTCARAAEVLGYFPDEWERLVRRWMRRFRSRERRAHAGEPAWTLLYPWERPD